MMINFSSQNETFSAQILFFRAQKRKERGNLHFLARNRLKLN